MDNEIKKLFNEEKEKYTIELTENQIAKICAILHSEIEECRIILDNYDMLDEKQKEFSRMEIKEKIQENKIIIEKVTNTHYPIFEWVISD